MKWVASILLIANVVIFLRVGDRQLDPGLQAAPVKPDINKDSMLLLHEVNPQAADAGALRIIEEEDGLEIAVLDSRENITVQADGQNEAVKSAESASASNDGSTEAEYVVAAEVALARSRDEIKWSCYRIGPFRDAAEWQLAQQWANSGSISFEPVRSESRELRAVRIYVGPFPTIADTRTDVALLKQKGLDHFVYMRDDNQARISLGYFTQEELAVKFVEYLVGQGVEAKSQPEYRTLGPFDWMDLQIDSQRREEVLSGKWGAEGVEITERQCTTEG